MKQIERTLTVFRFKDERIFYIYEQELVERLFVVRFLNNQTRLIIYGNTEQFYLNDFRVNHLKVYTAMAVLAKLASHQGFAMLEGGEQQQMLFQNEEDIDYGESGPDDKSDVGLLT